LTTPIPLRLLVVDDHEMSRTLIHAIIARSQHHRVRGATLVDAHDLAQARAAIFAEPFDVVLLDVQLPDGSGLMLLDDLANIPHARPAVIALTGAVLPHQRAAALDAGCDAFLDKPFLAEDLITLLEEVAPPAAAASP
jgi:two-component system, OmpR family, KDP operon response regulator KdpE